jgi:hypothetical protein
MRLVDCEAHDDPYHWTNRTMRTAGIDKMIAARALPTPVVLPTFTPSFNRRQATCARSIPLFVFKPLLSTNHKNAHQR